MTAEIRHQAKCYHASADYCRSFWGRYIYIYQGSGSLTLTSQMLSFHGRSLDFDLPLEAIRGIGLSEFSRMSKPFGLLALILRYEIGGKEFITHLVPYESNFAPTWETSKIVSSWYDTLRAQPCLAPLAEGPTFTDPESSSKAHAFRALGAGIAVALLGIALIFALRF